MNSFIGILVGDMAKFSLRARTWFSDGVSVLLLRLMTSLVVSRGLVVLLLACKWLCFRRWNLSFCLILVVVNICSALVHIISSCFHCSSSNKIISWHLRVLIVCSNCTFLGLASFTLSLSRASLVPCAILPLFLDWAGNLACSPLGTRWLLRHRSRKVRMSVFKPVGCPNFGLLRAIDDQCQAHCYVSVYS